MKCAFIVALSLAALASCSKEQKLESSLVPVTVAHPVLCDVPRFADYVGHIEPYTTVKVTSQIEGILQKQLFSEGQAVKEGDLLFIVDPRPHQASLQKTEAALAQSMANLKFDEETVRRYGKLIQDNYVSQLEFDRYVTAVMTDQATIKENLADIDQAKINLDYCHIRAPMDAVTSNVKVNVGNIVQNIGDNPLVILNQIAPIYASFFVPEKDLQRIQTLHKQCPLKVQVFLNQDTAHPFVGTLSLINNEVDEKTGMILFKAVFQNQDKQLWPGEFVDVRLLLGEDVDALLIPYQTVQIGQNGAYIFVVKADQTVEMRRVQTGQKIKNYIVVKEGVKPGEAVVLDGQINLFEGAKVQTKQFVSSDLEGTP